MADQDDTDSRQLDRARVGPRPRLPLPTWMAAWPRGVVPAGLSANARGVEFLYRAPPQPPSSSPRWFRVEASLQSNSRADSRAGERVSLHVRALPGREPEMGERLAKAVERQLLRSPLAQPWLGQVQALVERLCALVSFGGAGVEGPETEVVDRMLRCAIELRERSPERTQDEGSSAALEAALAEASARGVELGVITELGIIGLLAAGAFGRALDHWHRHAASIEARETRSALACAALMRGYLGDIATAQARAQRLASQAVLAADARQAGELLAQLGHPEAATSALRVAASDTVEDDAGAFAVHFRLAQVAAQGHDLDTLRWAAAAMHTQSDHPDKLLETARMQREGGDFSSSDATLAALLSDQPTHRGAVRMLADSKLWRLDHEGAAALCRPLLEANEGDVAALRTLGACEHLAGRDEAALELLTRALEIDAQDYQARLWRSEVLDQLGRSKEAAKDIQSVGIGDYPIWQLLRARIEERQVPGRRINHDTWFIVDTNIRQLVGDDAPADTAASHEIACAAIDQALARLGGNRTKRLTTLTSAGELRWLRTVVSPRQRAERLQLQACHRSVDSVVADFTELEQAYPAVPFFHTYSAELLLWCGEYEGAFHMFEQIWLATRTRWGYVGAGAAAMFLGQNDRALELWEEGKQYYSYIDAEATYCYRGELLRLREQLDAARADLELAVKARPGRVGAWVNLALLEKVSGNEAGLRAAVATVEGLIPAYAWEARREVGMVAPSSEAPPKLLERYMETLLANMRGNRSAVMHTIVGTDEQLRVVPAVGPDIWRDHGRRSLALFEDELLFGLAERT